MIGRTTLIALCSAMACAQEVLWSVSRAPGHGYRAIDSAFGDLDHDGFDDVLAFAVSSYSPFRDEIHVLSGLDGSLLSADIAFSQSYPKGVGDFDLDGHPDYAMLRGSTADNVDVRSPHLGGQILLTLTRPASTGWWGGVICGNVDLNGDGLPDLLISGWNPLESRVMAYDHSGSLLYSVPASSLGFLVGDIVPMGDMDGDGADDYVAGAVEVTGGGGRGAVILVSGRTGTPLRVTLGDAIGDLIGEPVCNAGDVDKDGITDYATGNFQSPYRGLVIIYSGRDGHVIQQWTRPWTQPPEILSHLIVCGRDADLDGVPDVSMYVPWQYTLPPLPPSQVFPGFQVFSTRDGQRTLSVRPLAASPRNVLNVMADLGVQPGSPYPVVALLDGALVGQTADQFITAWRLSPPGTAVIGIGCSSDGRVPTIGVRKVETSSGEDSRIVLGNAAPGAIAWCAISFAGTTAGGGVTVPYPLDPFGLSGCTLLVPPQLTTVRGVGTSGFDRGYAGIDLAPALVATGGTHFAAQWLVIDPVSAGYATTARHEFRLQ